MKLEVTEEGDGHILMLVDKGELAAQSKNQNNFCTYRLYGKMRLSMKLEKVEGRSLMKLE